MTRASSLNGDDVWALCCREDIKLDITGWEEKETELETKWRFSALLSLPWRPRLAASGGTTHVFDQVVFHCTIPERQHSSLLVSVRVASRDLSHLLYAI